jgi:hypothetical protein
MCPKTYINEGRRPSRGNEWVDLLSGTNCENESGNDNVRGHEQREFDAEMRRGGMIFRGSQQSALPSLCPNFDLDSISPNTFAQMGLPAEVEPEQPSGGAHSQSRIDGPLQRHQSQLHRIMPSSLYFPLHIPNHLSLTPSSPLPLFPAPTLTACAYTHKELQAAAILSDMIQQPQTAPVSYPLRYDAAFANRNSSSDTEQFYSICTEAASILSEMSTQRRPTSISPAMRLELREQDVTDHNYLHHRPAGKEHDDPGKTGRDLAKQPAEQTPIAQTHNSSHLISVRDDWIEVSGKYTAMHQHVTEAQNNAKQSEPDQQHAASSTAGATVFPRRKSKLPKGERSEDGPCAQPVSVTIEVLEQLSSHALPTAAAKLGISATAMKNACRKVHSVYLLYWYKSTNTGTKVQVLTQKTLLARHLSLALLSSA